jgi:hypothetical protein
MTLSKGWNLMLTNIWIRQFLNLFGFWGMAPLQYSAAKGSDRCFRSLLRMGANLRTRDLLNRKIDEFAVFGGSAEIIQHLKRDYHRKFNFGMYYGI